MRIALLIAVAFTVIACGCQKEIKEIRKDGGRPALALR